MIGETVSHYEILEKLGEGGGGVVYKARDTKLNRVVALKFLRPQLLGSKDDKDFLVREAQAAAALDHPNICTIYEIDETDGQIFISMAFIEGVSLKKRIQSEPFDLEEATHIAIQVAEGLEEAHRKGIVHRDIKSANIMVTDKGLTKITDFGLALLAEDAEVTSTEKIIGTPSYMSPEQARGDSVDQRADVWAWGVVFYEMLAGMLPFRGERPAALIYSILNDEPTSLSQVNAKVPVELEWVVNQALAKPVEDRYQDFAEVLALLQSPSSGLEFDSATRRLFITPPQPSIAVLAFEDMSPGKDQEYFCDGIAEEVINNLAHVGGLRVASRTSSFSYKGRREDIREIGRKLGVRTVLEGSVRKADNKLRINTQLINVADGCHLWSEQYDRELEDVFAIQEEIASRIAQTLKVELTEEERQVLEKAPTQSIAAYELYLRGRQYFYRSKRDSIDYALGMFARAIEEDPEYALAYAGIADCRSFLCMYFGGGQSDLEEANEASSKALELDPDLAEAHAARGLAESLSKSYEEAEKEFEAAIKLNPNLYEAHYFYARTCFVQGKHEEATRHYRAAHRVNPDEYQAASLLGFTYKTMGEAEKMERAYRRSLTKIERHLELNPDDVRATYLGAEALLKLNEREKAMEWVKRVLAKERDDPYTLYGISCIYAQIGEIEEGMYYLERAVQMGFHHKEWMQHDSDLDSLREHARYPALVKRLEER
jgi:serine/threonine protein kinase/cytochrome c-type biogenesis protein CcmH/NrfG